MDRLPAGGGVASMNDEDVLSEGTDKNLPECFRSKRWNDVSSNLLTVSLERIQGGIPCNRDAIRDIDTLDVVTDTTAKICETNICNLWQTACAKLGEDFAVTCDRVETFICELD